MNERDHLEELGVFVHGMLASFHLLGVVYNMRKRNWSDTIIHGCGVIYDTVAVTKHMRRLQNEHEGHRN
jgi:hypothetical protein